MEAREIPQSISRETAFHEPVTDPSEIYSGCYCNVVVDFWAQDDANRKGINGVLGGVMFKKDGERLGGGGNLATAADFDLEDDFEEAI